MKYLFPILSATLLFISIVHSQTSNKFTIEFSKNKFTGNKAGSYNLKYLIDETSDSYIALRSNTAQGTPTLAEAFYAIYDKSTLDLRSSVPLFNPENYDSKFLKSAYAYGPIELNGTKYRLARNIDKKLKSEDFYYVKTDDNYQVTGTLTKFFSLPLDDNIFSILLNRPHSEGLIIFTRNNFVAKSNEKENYSCYMLDAQFKQVKQIDFSFDLVTDNFWFSSFELNNSNQLIGLRLFETPSNEGMEPNYEVCRVDLSTGETTTRKLSKTKDISSLSINRSDDAVYCLGHYMNPNSKGIDGVYYAKLSLNDLSIIAEVKTEFENEFAKKVNKKNDGVDYNINVAVPKGIFKNSDGSFYLLCEQYYNDSRMLGTVGVMTTHRGCIVVSKIANDGKVIWNSYILKKSAYSREEHGAFYTDHMNDILYFYYVDNTKNFDVTEIDNVEYAPDEKSDEIDLICSVIDGEGKVEKTRLFSNKGYNAVFTPENFKKFRLSPKQLVGEVTFGDFAGIQALVRITVN